MVGGQITEQSLQCLAAYGRMVIYGAASGQIAQFSGIQLMYKNQAIIGYWLTSQMRRTDRIALAAMELMQHLASGKLEIIVGQTFPLAEAAEAPDAGERRALDTGAGSLGAVPVSRGYREEMEHLAYLIRTRDQATEDERRTLVPRCDGRAAMADAIIALTANQAMKHQRRIAFDESWYRAESTDVPDSDMRPEIVS